MNNKFFIIFFISSFIFSSYAKGNNGEWDFSLTPYAWFAGFEGVSGTFEDFPPVDVDLSAKDTFNDSDSSFALIFEAKRGENGVYIDYLYSNSLSEDEIFPLLELTSRSRTKTTMITFAYERVMINSNNSSLEFLAGTRWWQINSALTFKFANPENNRSINSTEQWLDPYVGIKGRTNIHNSNFYLVGAISIGGLGMNSDFFYDTNVNIGYQWTKTIGTAIGFRQYKLDYDKNNFVYDVKQAGWQIDLTWIF